MGTKEPQNCWEFNNCPEETRDKCRAYIANMGRECRLIASAGDNASCVRAKGKGLLYCAEYCSWYKKLNSDKEK